MAFCFHPVADSEHILGMLDGSYLNSVLPLGEVDLLLALALGLQGSLVLGETAAESTGELGAEVKRSVLLALVEQAELSALVGVDDGQNASDRLANVVAVKKDGISASLFFFFLS